MIRFESGFWICKNFWDISTNAWDTDFFFCQFGLNLWKFEKEIGYLCQIDRSFDRRGGKNRFQREIGANGSPILPTFCQYNKVKPWKFEKLKNFKEKIDFLLPCNRTIWHRNEETQISPLWLGIFLFVCLLRINGLGFFAYFQ